MTEGNLPFLNEEGVSDDMDAAPVETPEPAPAPEEPKGEPAAPPAASEDAIKTVPLAALESVRDKGKAEKARAEAAEKKAAELERQLAEMQRAQTQQAPDFFGDPEGRLMHERAQIQQVVWNATLNTSEMIAVEKHGAEVVEAAKEAFLQEASRNPALFAELQRRQNPYGFVVEWHERQSFLAKLGDDPQAYIDAQVKARLEAMQAAQPKPAAPPPSLASAPGVSGGREPPASGFAALFGDK